MADILNFIDELNKEKRYDDQVAQFQTTPESKLRRLSNTKEECLNTCLTNVLGKVCQRSLPEVNGIVPDVTDIDSVVRDYISRRTGGKNAEFYVKEAIKKKPNNTALKSLLESCEQIVKELYLDKSINPNTISSNEEFTFKITPEINDRLEAIVRNNNFDDLAEVIKDNVKDAAIIEVEKAKKEQEERKNLEKELSKDDSITSEAALNDFLKSKGLDKCKIYKPTLFEGVLINKFNTMAMNESAQIPEEIDMSMYTEGFIKDTISNFKAKKAAKAEKTIADSMPGYIATLQSTFKYMYSAYRTNIASINSDNIEKNVKAVLGNNQENYRVKLPNIREYSDYLTLYKRKIKENMKSILPSGKIKKYKTASYTVSDALTQYKASLRYVNKILEDGDMEGYVKKYVAFANTHVRSKSTPTEVDKAFDYVVNYVTADSKEVLAHIDFVYQFSQYVTKISKTANFDLSKSKAFESALTEYALLNISKALYLESFTMSDINDLAYEYAKN